MADTNRVLIVVTSTGGYKKADYRTGLWLGELTHFLDIVERAGFDSTIVSVEGGRVPIDPESLTDEVLGEWGTEQRYANHDFMNRLEKTHPLAEVDASHYDAVYLTGGHGARFDFPHSASLTSLITRFAETGKVVAAVCHGPWGLLGAQRQDGAYLVDGKDVTGFSRREEELSQREHAATHSLQDELEQRGANYVAAATPFEPHVAEDGVLITGQNPRSASAVASAVVSRFR